MILAMVTVTVVVGAPSSLPGTLGPVVAIALIVLLVIREMVALRGARTRRWRNALTVGLVPVLSVFLFTIVARPSPSGTAVALGGSAGTSSLTPSIGISTSAASRATSTPPAIGAIGRIARPLFTVVSLSPAALALHDDRPDSGGHQERLVHIVNRGRVPFTIGSIVTEGRDSSDFNQSSTCVGRIIHVGAGCTIIVSFTPIWPTTRVRHAHLTISTIDAQRAWDVVSLSGRS